MSKDLPVCSCGNLKYIDRDVCYDCYKDLFKANSIENTPINATISEEDFVLGSEVAKIVPIEPVEYIEFNQQRKKYEVDFSKVQSFEELKLIVEALFTEIIIFNNNKNFNDIKHLLKEVK